MGETEEQKTRKEKTRRQFGDEFKKDAVRLFESGNSSLRQVAKDLGISNAKLFNWVDKARKERRDVGVTPDLAAEIRRLREARTSSSQWCKEILRRLSHQLGEGDRRELIYQFIDTSAAEFPVSVLCRVLCVSRSAY